jgi:hypothetical protein
MKKASCKRQGFFGFPQLWWTTTGSVVGVSWNQYVFKNAYYYPEINLFPKTGGWGVTI